MSEKLTEAQIEERLSDFGGWTHADNEIRKTYQFVSFAGAIAFVTHAAFLAEAAGHHPNIDIRHNKVMIALTTYDAGGLTQKDFDLAEQIDEILD